MATREEALKDFAQVIANAVVAALNAQPPTVSLPEPVLQALMRIAAQPVPQPVVTRPVLDPISAMQQQLQLQGQPQGFLQQPKPYQVLRFDENGNQYYQDVTIPQLLAEMCDLLHDHAAMLEQIAANGPARRRRKKAVAFG